MSKLNALGDLNKLRKKVVVYNGSMFNVLPPLHKEMAEFRLNLANPSEDRIAKYKVDEEKEVAEYKQIQEELSKKENLSDVEKSKLEIINDVLSKVSNVNYSKYKAQVEIKTEFYMNLIIPDEDTSYITYEEWLEHLDDVSLTEITTAIEKAISG